MNKWQIICPVTVMFVVAVVFAIRSARVHREIFVLSQTHAIAGELLSETNSVWLAKMSPDLRARLSVLLADNAGIDRCAYGDAPAPIGNGTADSHVVLTNAAGREMGIRLANTGGEFDTLGWWTNWQ